MSIRHAKQALTDFVADDKPGSLILTGRWGVGKTYVWDQVRQASKTARPYGRVSLFGIADLHALKTTIFLNTAAEKADGPLQKGVILGDKAKKLAPILKLIPHLKDFDPSVFYGHLIRGSLICLDDLERSPSSLDLKDVLGLVSFLKEERDCKVIVIANDEAFEGRDATFRTHFEKVFDRRVRYEPTAEEATLIAAPGSDRTRRFVRKYASALELTNIRVLTKMVEIAAQIDAALSNSEDNVVEALIRSVVVIGRSVLEPHSGPSVSFLREDLLRRSFGLRNGSDDDPAHVRWEQDLHRLGFLSFGEEEKIICAGFEKGYLDTAGLAALVVAADDRERRAQAREPAAAAITTILNTWTGTTEECLQELDAGLARSGKALYLNELALAISLLEALDRPDLADYHARNYVHAFPVDAPIFSSSQNDDIGKYPARLRDIIHAHRTEPVDGRPITEVLAHIENDAHHLHSLIRLGEFSVEEIQAGLRAYGGRDLKALWRNVYHQSVSEPARERMHAAIENMARTSLVDRYRAGLLGLPSPVV